MSEHAEAQGKSGTQVLERAGALLRLLTANNRTGLRLVELFRMSGLERPTAHRILQALVSERLVRQDQKSKRYFLGAFVYEMGLAATPPVALRDIGQPFLKALADETGDTVFLGLRSGLDSVCVARAEGSFPIKAFVLNVGHRRPLNVGGSGLAILSALDESRCAQICAANLERSLKLYPRYDPKVVERQLAEARRVGYVLNDVLNVKGARSIGMPIRDSNREVIASLSISAVSARISGQRVRFLSECMSATTAKISSAYEVANRTSGQDIPAGDSATESLREL